MTIDEEAAALQSLPGLLDFGGPLARLALAVGIAYDARARETTAQEPQGPATLRLFSMPGKSSDPDAVGDRIPLLARPPGKSSNRDLPPQGRRFSILE